MKYTKHFSTTVTPQSEPIPGSNQVTNSAGGYAWQVDDWKRLDRFLVLGTEGNSYYSSEHKLTKENAEAVLRCIKADGKRVVDRIVEISEAGRAPKNDPALFALAMCAGLGNTATRKCAMEALPRVARIGTHLFHFLDAVQSFRGWGRGLRLGTANWYNEKDAGKLAYQVVKYRQRDGWSHRDALRLAHPNPPTDAHKAIYHWIAKDEPSDALPQLIQDFIKLQSAEDEKQAISSLVANSTLTWEMVPSQFLGSANVWAALLPNIQMTALIRNLGRMTANELLKPMSEASKIAVTKIFDAEQLRKARVHPIAVLSALMTYKQGHGEKGNLTWNPVPQIVDALDSAFYASFHNVEPTNKNILLAVDVSGSMSVGVIAGVPGLTPRDGAAAMALVTASTEPNYHIIGFSDRIFPVSISKGQRLDDAIRKVSCLSQSGTDCALPMLEAMKQKWSVDAFVSYTDSQTWLGTIHPAQALEKYRHQFNPKAKMVTVAMVANEFSIADPNDGGSVDVIGFDTATPNLIGDFIRGGLT